MSSAYSHRGFQFHKAGLNSTGNYQMSGVPAISGSVVVPANNEGDGTGKKLEFPSITRSITIRNDSSNVLRVGFAASAMSGAAGAQGTHYFKIPASGSFSEEWRVADIWVLSDNTSQGLATVIGSLTGIPRDTLPTNWSGSSENPNEVDGWLT